MTGLWDSYGDLPASDYPHTFIDDEPKEFGVADWLAMTKRMEANKRSKGLGVGRMVHFSRGDLCLAAIVTQVIDKEGGIIACTLFEPLEYTPIMRHSSQPPSYAVFSVRYSEDHEMGTWHWPEFVE
jgi:hypothetical protein